MQMTVGGAEAHDEQLGIVCIADHLQVGHLDVGNLLLAQTRHQVVVLRVGRDGTRLRVLLQTAQDMREALAARHCPVAGAVLSAHIGSPLALQLLRNIRGIDAVELVHLGQAEGS